MQGGAVLGEAGAQRVVAEGTQPGLDAVYHGRTEHAVTLEDVALALQAVGRGRTTVGQLAKGSCTAGESFVVYVVVHIGALSQLLRPLHLEAVTAGHAESCDELVDIGRSVGRTHLDGLLERRVVA